MNRRELLKLHGLSKLTVAEIEEQSPGFLHRIERRLEADRTRRLDSLFSDTSVALRAGIARIGAPRGASAEEVGANLLDSLTKAGVNKDVLSEAGTHLSTLDLSGLTSSAVAPDRRLTDVAHLRPQLERARFHAIGELAGLDEAEVDAIADRIPTIASLDAISLAELVEGGTIGEGVADEMARATSLFNLLDGNTALLAAVPEDVLEARDLAKLDAAAWAKVISGAGVEPPEGLDVSDWAQSLADRAAFLLPSDAFFARILPRDPVASVRALSGSEPDERERFLNRFKGLALDETRHDPKLTLSERIDRTADRLVFLARVVARNADLELLGLDYSPGSDDLQALVLEGLTSHERDLVLATLKSYQRIHAITRHVSDTIGLLEAGYTSGSQIAATSSEAFLERTRLDPGVAALYHERATRTLGETTALVGSVLDITSRDFDNLAITQCDPRVIDYLNEIDGFQRLFGREQTCRCEACQSLLGKPAYLVDLLWFVEERVLSRVFKGAHESHRLNLKVRRPDLWTLPLACEATHTLVPALDLTNEVLERAIALSSGHEDAVSDRGALERAVYHEVLSAAEDSFRQPFWLPISQIEAFLAHFGTTRAEVIRLLGGSPEHAAAAELGLCPIEHGRITESNPGPVSLRRVFGVDFDVAHDGSVTPFDADLVLGAMGVDRAQLEALLATHFVTGDGEPLTLRRENVGEQGEGPNAVRVHGAHVEALDRLHRFTRVWHRLPWTAAEIDLVLSQLGVSVLAGEGFRELVDVYRLATRLGLPVEDMGALIGPIPTQPIETGGTALFDRLFNPPHVVEGEGRIDPTGPTGPTGGPTEGATRGLLYHHAWTSESRPTGPANGLRLRLMTGLGVGGDNELDDLFEALWDWLTHPDATPADETESAESASPADDAKRTVVLDLSSLSLLVRHARLTECLGVSVAELFQLIHFAPEVDGRVVDLDDLMALIAFWDELESSRYGLDDLGFMTKGPVRHPESYPDAVELASAIVAKAARDRSLVFSRTEVARLEGVTKGQSRSIVEANPRAIEVREGGDYWLAPRFGPASHLSIPDDVGITEAQVRSALMPYHTSRVLPALLGAVLEIPEQKAAALVEVAGRSLNDARLADALRGTGSLDPLADLVGALLPLWVLFREAVFDPDTIRLIGSKPRLFPIDHGSRPTLDAIRALSAYVRVIDPEGAGAEERIGLDPRDVLAVLEGFSEDRGFGGSDSERLARILGSEPELVATLRERVSLPSSALEALETLGNCVTLASELGVLGQTLGLIASSDYAELAQAAEGLARSLRRSYPNEAGFRVVSEPIEERIRSRRRDGLTDYLLHTPDGAIADGDELDATFLVDTRLDGRVRTSRVEAAVSSIQTYVQRILLNLERDGLDAEDAQHVEVSPELIPRDEWAWRQSYDAWEAARKVFVYAENGLAPELRDDRSPLFDTLEASLARDPSDHAVLDAYTEYLAGFDEVGRLNIAGAYRETDESSGRDTLHLVGVSPHDPPRHYYRTAENLFRESFEGSAVTWSPWRPIDLSIGARRVAPVVYGGRLYLFWVDITTRRADEIIDGTPRFAGYDHRMALELSVLGHDGSWAPPQRVSLALGRPPFETSSGLIKDRFGYDTSQPKYAGESHNEPRDDYTLNGPNWEGVFLDTRDPQFPGQLAIAARNFAVNASIHLYGRAVRGQQALHNNPPRVATPLLCARPGSGSPGGRDLFYGCPVFWYSNRNAFANLVIDESRIDLFAVDGLTEDVKTGLYAGKLAELGDGADLMAIPGAIGSAIIQRDGDVLLLHGTASPQIRWRLQRIGSTVASSLGERLFRQGLGGLLDTAYQLQLAEAPHMLTRMSSRVEDLSGAGGLGYTGSNGAYYREIFLHIPLLIAERLRTERRFAAAQQWYHRVFDPTAADAALAGRDRVWRYRQFRNLDVEGLRALLAHPDPVAASPSAPLNPHAIARLRLGAYQRYVVTKYVDNVLDWADDLFARATRDSVGAATRLYALAGDLLGRSPARSGRPAPAPAQPPSYTSIRESGERNLDILADLETIRLARRESPSHADSPKKGARVVLTPSALATADHHLSLEKVQTDAAGGGHAGHLFGADGTTPTGMEPGIDLPQFGWALVRQLGGSFCVPANRTLESRRARVEDRLAKIRRGLDLDGFDLDVELSDDPAF